MAKEGDTFWEKQFEGIDLSWLSEGELEVKEHGLKPESEFGEKISMEKFFEARDTFFRSLVFNDLVQQANISHEVADALINKAFEVARKLWDECQTPEITEALNKMGVPNPRYKK